MTMVRAFLNIAIPREANRIMPSDDRHCEPVRRQSYPYAHRDWLGATKKTEALGLEVAHNLLTHNA